MRIVLVDTVYPEFAATLPRPKSYAEGLGYALSRMFGTFDAYSRNLRMLGHECIDIIANHSGLQDQWLREYSKLGHSGFATLMLQIDKFSPDVIFLQDLSSVFSAGTLRYFSRKGITLAGQLSCAFEDDEKLRLFDALFTSFPFNVERFNKLGVRGEFLPLAFDPLVLERARIPEARTHAVSFVGGYGRHWDVDRFFTTLVEQTPLQIWGYGWEKAPKVIRDRWQGPAWGLDMYEIYLRSHIVVNRHGGVSRGLSNNLRMFEATGCGAMLLTERSPNIRDYFTENECSTYTSAEDAVEKINHHLNDPMTLRLVSSLGQQRTLSTHTYAQRMATVSKVLTEVVERKQVSA